MKDENNIAIQQANKGNTIVIFGKDSYFKSFVTLLKDSLTFKSIPVALDKDLNYVINYGERVTDLLKKLKNKDTIS